MKKITNILLSIFSIGILCSLASGVLMFLSYIYALIIGGTEATEICYFILKECTPWVIKFTSIIIGIGLITMYLKKQRALAIVKEDKKIKTNKK